MKITFLFAWYDLWVGIFYDKDKRKLYVLPIPCVGVIIHFNKKEISHTDDPYKDIKFVDINKKIKNNE